MGRRDYEYWTVTGVKGINQQEDLADPQLELADARNLWAPDGALISRPGDKPFSQVVPPVYRLNGVGYFYIQGPGQLTTFWVLAPTHRQLGMSITSV